MKQTNEKCEKCNSDLVQITNFLICPIHGQVKSLIDVATTWSEETSQDHHNWHKAAFEEYPSIIAHEYWRLYGLLKEGKTFGALLQLKDMFEVIIKFPVLIVASHIYQKRDRSDTENKIMISLLEKPLSLGHWKQIAQTIKKEVKVEENIDYIVENIISFYEEIPAWRNENIGHGALLYNEEELRSEIEDKLPLLKKHLEECQSYYNHLKTYISTENQKRYLVGKDNARNLEVENTELLIDLNGKQIPLYPYILLENNNIFFFDSFNRYAHRASLLNYTDGKKQNYNEEVNQIIDRYFSAFSLSNNRDEIHSKHSFEEESYSLIEEAIVNKIQEVNDFQKPSHLENWLKENLDKRSKGIFLLQLERGLGKTTFSRSLDELSIYKIKLPNTSVRAHYINDSYSYIIKNFLSSVKDQLRLDKSGRNFTSKDYVETESSEDKKKSFAQLLNTYHYEHKKYLNKDKLLFIIDGLDEIPSKSNPSIFDFIPTSGMLKDGVYILLTCRTDSELEENSFCKNRIKLMTPCDRIEVLRNSEDNVKTLIQYTKKHVFKEDSLSQQQQKFLEWMLEHSENRFLYLKLLKELLAIKSEMDYSLIPKGEDLFSYYFETLESMYGDKFFKQLIFLLSTISTAYEPLTYREVSTLLGEEKPTFKLLAYLSDIRGFLNIDRSYRGNLLSISHQSWKDATKENYIEEIRNLINNWENQFITNGMQLMKDVDWSNSIHDGHAYLLTYLHQYLSDYEIVEKDEKNLVVVYSGILKNQSLYKLLPVYQLLRSFRLHTNLINSLKNLFDSENQNNLAKTLINRGYIQRKLEKKQEALTDYNEAIIIRKKLLKQKKLNDINDLASAFTNRGAILGDLGQNIEAIDDYTRAIKIQKELYSNGNYFIANQLAVTFMNRGAIYFNIGEEGKSLNDHCNAVKILQTIVTTKEKVESIETNKEYMSLKDTIASWKEIVEECKLTLPFALSNRGMTYSKINEPSKALDDCNQAIKIYQELFEEGKLEDLQSFAISLIGRGSILIEMDELDQALADYNEAISLQRSLIETGKFYNNQDLLDALINRSTIFRIKGDLDKALNDCDEAMEILRKLEKEGKLYSSSGIIRALESRASSLFKLGKLEEALRNYNEAIQFELDEMELDEFYDKNLYAKTLMNRGITLDEMGQPHEAILSYNEAFSILSKLISKGKDHLWNDLAAVLVHRGITLSNIKKDDEAIKDYNESVKIRRKLLKEGKLITKNDLALALINRANSLRIKGEYDLAYQDLNETISIRRELMEKGKLIDLNELAFALTSRGLTVEQLYGPLEAIKDYNEAILIQQGLQEKGKLFDLNSLATSLFNRGCAYWETGSEIKSAIRDLNKTIEIRTKLMSKEKLFDLNDYAFGLLTRAAVYEEAEEVEKIITDCDEIIRFYGELKKKSIEINNDFLEMAIELRDKYNQS